MERKSGTEKFKPLMVAAFSKGQLRQVNEWAWKNTQAIEGSLNFLKALEIIELDEKGKSMNEKSRNRLNYAIKAIKQLADDRCRLHQIQGPVIVWQTGPDGGLGLEYVPIKPGFNLRSRIGSKLQEIILPRFF